MLITVLRLGAEPTYQTHQKENNFTLHFQINLVWDKYCIKISQPNKMSALNDENKDLFYVKRIICYFLLIILLK
jgi:hypothetical protein